MNDGDSANARYWDEISDAYQDITSISCSDFHYGPLLPGDRQLNLLPDDLAGKRCLELACGAGQNSIYLASRGAECIAIDNSQKQLSHGRQLAEAHGQSVEFIEASIDRLPDDLGCFDLIHSSYGIPFAADPPALICEISKLLKAGGHLLVSMAHPIFSGEWLEIDGEGEGLFLRNYFSPERDVRFSEKDDELMVFSRSFPISESLEWFQNAGLQFVRLLEPQALAVPLMSEEEIAEKIPYHSPLWKELYPQISKVPVVVIFKLQKS